MTKLEYREADWSDDEGEDGHPVTKENKLKRYDHAAPSLKGIKAILDGPSQLSHKRVAVLLYMTLK